VHHRDRRNCLVHEEHIYAGADSNACAFDSMAP